MRLKLTLKQSKPKQLIPDNYQYAISSFIYRTIERSDSTYSKWLHDNGFADGNKKFKFFNFSDFIIFEKRWAESNRIEILSDTIILNVSIVSDKTVEHLIIGMFESGRMKIFDNISEAEFVIKYAETIPEPEFSETMKYRAFTPAVLSKKIIKDGKEKIYFLDPSESDYNIYFVNNLLAKYKVYSGKEISEQQSKFEINVLSEPKKMIRSVKSNGIFETKIRGYKYDFEMKAPVEIQRLAWLTGIGIKNSLGFGFINKLS